MNAGEKARRKWDHAAGPLRSPGLPEDVTVRIAGVHETADGRIDNMKDF